MRKKRKTSAVLRDCVMYPYQQGHATLDEMNAAEKVNWDFMPSYTERQWTTTTEIGMYRLFVACALEDEGD